MDTKWLVGKAKLIGDNGAALKCWAAATVLVLAGCGATPLTVKPSAEPEKRLSQAKAKASAPKAPAAKASARATGASLALSPAGTAKDQPGAPAPDHKATQAGNQASPLSPLTDPEVAAPLAATSNALTLIERPNSPLHLMVMRGPDDSAIDILCDPEDGLAAFVVQAPPQGITVSKALIELVGVDKTASVELTRADLEWPTKVVGRTTLKVPILLYETLRVLSENPTATKVTFKATLFGADGKPLAGADGETLVLTADATVF